MDVDEQGVHLGDQWLDSAIFFLELAGKILGVTSFDNCKCISFSGHCKCRGISVHCKGVCVGSYLRFGSTSLLWRK
jgi:hypothetical protein